MQTRSASPVQPETPDARPRVGIESPWSSAVETELRVRAESSRNFWKSRAGELEEELRRVRATLDGTNCLQFMDRKGSQFRRESQVLRDKLRARYDKRNWAELCISALAAQREGEIDYTCDVRDCVAFRSALKEIHRHSATRSARSTWSSTPSASRSKCCSKDGATQEQSRALVGELAVEVRPQRARR